MRQPTGILMFALAFAVLGIAPSPVTGVFPGPGVAAAAGVGHALRSASVGSITEPAVGDAWDDVALAAPMAPTTSRTVVSRAILTAAKDAFLNQRFPDNNTGGHDHVAAGLDGTGNIRRGVVAFDVSGSLPAGSTILTATLTLSVIQTPPEGVNSSFQLHRLTRTWSEGNKIGNNGSAASAGEVTWNASQHATSAWTTPGGDFVPTVSASTPVTGVGSYAWGSTSQMVADVQAWLDSPAANSGWLLRSENETALRTVRQFGSKEGGNAATLTIDYLSPPELRVPCFLPMMAKSSGG
jgi:hypothetical protein